MGRWSVHYFPITDKHLENFMRHLPRPKDCVINAIELLGIVHQDIAGLMRILVGNTGVGPDQITDIFRWVYPDYNWRFHPIPISYTMRSDILHHFSNIPPGRVVFGGVTWTGGERHVILFGKSADGTLVAIDPQATQRIIIGMDAVLKAYLALASEVYFLESDAIHGDGDDRMGDDRMDES